MRKAITHVKTFLTKRSLNTMANQISIIRILLVPLIVIGILEGHMPWATLLFVICIASDFIDGMVARARGEQTKLGAFLDPVADKLLIMSVFATLSFLGVIRVWFFVVIFTRDLLIILGWTIIYILTGNSRIQPRILGKITTAVQMSTALALMVPFRNPGTRFLSG